MLQMGICKHAMTLFAKKLEVMLQETRLDNSDYRSRDSVLDLKSLRKNARLLLLFGLLLCTVLTGSTDAATIPKGVPPVLVVSGDTTLYICDTTQVCIKLHGDDADGDDLSVSKISGTGTLGTVFSPSPLDTNYCFIPDTSGVYCFVFELDDDSILNGVIEDDDDVDTVCITIVFNEPPSIACPPDVNIGCDGSTDTSITGAAVLTSSDSCSLVTLQYVDSTIAGSCPQEFTIYRSWQAVDELSNVLASCVQTITIVDSLPPQILSCPSDTTITSLLDLPVCDSSLITAQDNCGTLSITCNRTDAGGTGCANDPRIFIDSFTVSDECGNVSYCSRTIRLIDGSPPTILDQGFSARQCDLKAERSLQVVASDPGGQLTFKLVSGNGVIDSISGIITYIPDTSGTFLFTVAAIGSCGADTAVITDQLLLNSVPQVICTDSIVTLCSPQEICFDVFSYDPDGDSVQISMLEGLGTFAMTSDTSGQTCFIPANVDSAVYMFVYRVADSCTLSTPPALADPGCVCEDTTFITVLINQPPVLECPGPQDFFACELDTFYFDLLATDPDGDSLTFSVLSGNASINGRTVSVVGFDSASFDVVIQSSDDCGNSDTCTVPVTITPNSAPYVSTDNDFDVFLCQPEQICFGATVLDYDGNLANISLNWGTYNPATNMICFQADTAGQYTIIVDAADSCGAITSDTTIVNVTVNDLPFVDLGVDIDTSMCGLGEICIDATVTDGQIKYVSPSIGYYNGSTGQVCFLPDTSGVYTIIVTAGDFCGETAVDTILVTVRGQLPPEVNLGPDTSVILCDVAEVCIDVTTIRNYQSITTNLGTYNPQTGQVCFLPGTSDIYQLIVGIVDTCGTMSADTVAIDVSLRTAPVVSGMSDTTIYLCLPEPVCIPYTVTDPDNDLDTVYTSFGGISDSQVCFLPYDSGHYQIIVTAIDSCGAVSSDTAVVWIRTDQEINLQVPNDTDLFVCQLDTLCFPISGFPDDAQISVSGINTWYDASTRSVCFYSDCATTNNITVTATTQCGAYSSSFIVQTLCNDAPLVILPPDTSIFACDTSEICLPVGISDADGNLSVVEVQGAVYDPLFSQVCFTPDTAGVYSIVVKATDSCGAFRSDTLLATVQLNEPPVSNLPGDTSIFLCAPAEIRLPISVFDANSNFDSCLITSGPGIIQNGYWIYTPSGSETVTVSIQCFDSCSASTSGQFSVSITINSAPVSEADIDTAFSQCLPTEVCIPVGATDSDLNLDSAFILNGPGTLVNGSWCYTPTGDDSVQAVIRFTDSCGAFSDQIIRAKFQMNQDPVAVCPGDTVLVAGDLSEICLGGFGGLDADGDSLSIQVVGGVLRGDSVCFTPVAGPNSIKLIVTDECGESDSCVTIIDVIQNTSPVCQLPNDTIILGCNSGQIALPVVGVDQESNLLGCEIISGPGTLVDGYWIYTPQGTGPVTATIRCTDSLGAFCEGSFTVDVQLNSPPIVADTAYSSDFCEAGVTRSLQVIANDIENDVLTYQLISGSGVIDSLTGLIIYIPDTSGSYSFEVSVADSCGADTAMITDMVSFNKPPLAFGYDTTLYLCSLQDVCLDFYGSDPDGDILSITQIEGPGQFTPTSDSSGQLCFTPAPVDSADYRFVFCVADSCLQSQQACVYDTINVTVITNRSPQITCPVPQTFVACQLDTFCFDINGIDPDGDSLTFNIISGAASITGNTVCVVGGADSAVFDITVEAVDACGLADTCSFTVSIIPNSAPLVSAANDFDLSLCQAGQICFDASVIDSETNLASIFTNFGSYNDTIGQFCFDADTSGTYTLILTAIDSCDFLAGDTTVVTVNMNSLPTVQLPGDFAVSLCVDSLMCFDASILDDNAMTTLLNYGTYDSASNTVCVMLDTAGIYTIIASITDSCAVTAADTLNITVAAHVNPVVDLGIDSTIPLCGISEVCLPVMIPSNYMSLFVGFGQYDELTGELCFGPDTAGIYTLWVDATDSCGAIASDTVQITLTMNNSPSVSMSDTTYYICLPQPLCIAVDVNDPDGDLMSVTATGGYYSNGTVCFLPYDSGRYQIIVTAVDSCGLTAVDTAYIIVQTDQGVAIQVPSDTVVFACQLDTFCFPVGGIPDGAQVAVTGINTWFDSTTSSICFYSECATTNYISVSVSTPCNTFTESFVVQTLCNSDPLVFLPPDTTVTVCDSADICLPVGISDQDGNLTEVIVTGGWYDSTFNRVCFTPAGPGTYTLAITAIDSCGATGTDQIVVTVLANSPPQISYTPTDSVFRQCVTGQFQEICLPLSISDADNNIIGINSSVGSYNTGTGELCFTPDTAGIYCIEIVATDSCQATDSISICVTVEKGDFVTVQCSDSSLSLCSPDSVCIPVTIAGNYDSVVTSFGSFADTQVCFLADTAGTYSLFVMAFAECNIDTNTALISVVFGDSVSIACPNDTSVSLCGPDTLDFPFELLTLVDSVKVDAPAYLSGNAVSVPVFAAGQLTINLIAFGSCGVDSCSFNVMAMLNSPPIVAASGDTSLLVCTFQDICVPFTVSDPDNNVDSVSTSLGQIVNSQVCFLPGNFGSFEIIITAYDGCMATGVDTVVVNVVSGNGAAIICPQNQFATICGPDSVCVIAPITPSDAIVTVLPNGNYDPATGKVCVYVEQEGVQTITVIAESGCGSDTCTFDLNVTMAEVPLVNCPAVLDTTVCVSQIDSICFPVGVQGTGVSVNVNPFGTFTAGEVCFPVDSAGSYKLEIIGFSACGADTCYTTVNIFDDSPPVLTLPFDTTLIRCPGDTELVCIDGIFGSDAESLLSLNMVCGGGSFDLVSVDSGQVCFRPDTIGTYEFCFAADDGCASTSGSFFVYVEEKANCDVCVRLSIDPGECVPVGVVKNIDFNIETNGPIGGFDVLVAYDASVMTFQGTTIQDGAIDGWEYFTYRLNSGGCGNACPPGLIRFIAIADQNNGNVHPPDSTLRPNGKLFTAQFLVANDQNLGDQFLPIYFVWYDCGDNLFSNDVGDKAFVDKRIFTPEMALVWDEDDDVTFSESNRIFGVGAPDSCIDTQKPSAPQRCIEFINGGICVIHPDTLDARGDLNLNDVPFEIADAVLFSNYFIHGLAVFTINVPGQTAASDVNADGFTLTVADLVLLIRIIIGDAAPVGKIVPYAEQAVIAEGIVNGRMTVETETIQEIGAALFVYELKDATTVESVQLGRDAQNMKMLYSVRGNALTVLIFDLGRNSISSGSNTLLDIELSGDARMVLTHNELVDYQGRPYIAAYKGPAIPYVYSLEQNYPNPFNPVTSIRFNLLRSSDWSLDVFNITGKVVRRFEGSGDAGAMTLEWDGTNESGVAVASGVYLYRLTAGEFSDTRKMILLK